jgi:hypothetical protein
LFSPLVLEVFILAPLVDRDFNDPIRIRSFPPEAS